MDPQISIIVPVYNVEQYLPQCIDSILDQTFSDFELLLIDDGSPDKSGEICDEYAKKDNRIRVFHKENGGVSSARNLGLDNAESEWVTFVDADDWISKKYIENLYAPILSDNEIEFVQAGCTNYVNNKIANIEQQYDYFKGEGPLFVFNHFRGLTFSKLFNLENVIRIHGLRFDEQMRTTEDMAFTLDYLIYVKKYCFIAEVGYYYRHNTESLTHSRAITPYKNSLAEFKHLHSSVQKYIDVHCIVGKDRKFRKQQNANRLFSTLINIYKHNMTKEERLLHLKYDFLDNEISVLSYLNTSFVQRVLATIYMHKQYVLFDFLMYMRCLLSKSIRKLLKL